PREELGLRSKGVDSRTNDKTYERRGPKIQQSGDEKRIARRRPEERMVCQPTALVAELGVVAVRGIRVDNAVVDTGAQSVLIGKKLGEQLKAQGDLELVERGLLILTAEGGAPKWMPCTMEPIEITLQPGEKGETKIRVQCGMTESDDYDILLGMELLFRVGATICTWEERVQYRTERWREGGELGELPVRFVKTEPKRAWRVGAVRGERKKWDGESALAGMGAKLSEYSVTLVELFKGIGAGLAAALEAGLEVKKWLYIEIDPEVRKMAWSHVRALQERYPAQLRNEVILEAMKREHWDVREIRRQEVRSWEKVDLLVAGWECQGTSRAGKGRGLQDERTGLVKKLLEVMASMREEGEKYLYILEHVDMKGDPREPVRAVREMVEAQLGKGVSWDAALHGARCHRSRCYWQNVLPEEDLRARLSRVERDDRRIVEDILELGRVAAPVWKPDHPLQHQCNRIGEARQALPTLVAYPGARGFVEMDGQPGPGMIYDHKRKRWEEPTALERELAMGYHAGATAAPSVSEEARRAAVGKAIDQHSLRWLIGEMRKGAKGPGGKKAWGERGLRKQSAYSAVELEKEVGGAPRQEKLNVTKGPEKEWKIGADVEAGAAEAIKQLLKAHRGTFAYNLQELGQYKGGELEIKLTTEIPTYQRGRRMSAEDAAICKEKCEELLTAGIIRPSESSYAAATVVAARKDLTGAVLSRWMCWDYRAVIFTTLDLRQGFNQIAIREEDKRKTAFHGVDGFYEYNKMPFGMRNASAVFQRAMDQELRGIPAPVCYIDDVLVFSKSDMQHVEDLRRTLEAIAAAGLTCHPEKCKIARRTVAYLGFEVKGGRLGIQEAKFKVLDKLAPPKDKSGLRALLGFLNYYRKFVPNFSRRANLLNQLLREGK
ncbi:unnamed protein product, partial [Closterium sp. NIES-54]